VKIKTKNKWEGNNFFFDWMVKLKRKITLTKGRKNKKKMRAKLKKVMQHKLWLKGENENQ